MSRIYFLFDSEYAENVLLDDCLLKNDFRIKFSNVNPLEEIKFNEFFLDIDTMKSDIIEAWSEGFTFEKFELRVC